MRKNLHESKKELVRKWEWELGDKREILCIVTTKSHHNYWDKINFVVARKKFWPKEIGFVVMREEKVNKLKKESLQKKKEMQASKRKLA